MQPRLAIIPPQAKPRIPFADMHRQIDRALELAWKARAADEAGDPEAAQKLRAEHDTIYAELAKRLS